MSDAPDGRINSFVVAMPAPKKAKPVKKAAPVEPKSEPVVESAPVVEPPADPAPAA